MNLNDFLLHVLWYVGNTEDVNGGGAINMIIVLQI